MTKREFVEKMIDFDENYYTKYLQERIVTYKYAGQTRTRSEFELTDTGKELFDLANNSPFRFICPCCKKSVSFGDLEYWDESVDAVLNNEVTCSVCYEEEMGEDL